MRWARDGVFGRLSAWERRLGGGVRNVWEEVSRFMEESDNDTALLAYLDRSRGFRLEVD